MFQEPDFAERLKAQSAARAAMLEKLKPKPSVKAQELVPWDEREAARIRALIERPKAVRAVPVIVQMPPAASMAAAVVESVIVPFEPIRYSVAASDEFVIPCGPAPTVRRKAAAKAWRLRAWADGTRHCYYCAVRMTLGAVGKGKKQAAKQNANPPKNLATVDHREPLVLGGDDAPWNWVLACWSCNALKGPLTEAEFRAQRSLAVAAE